jgi:hypothetical protein
VGGSILGIDPSAHVADAEHGQQQHGGNNQLDGQTHEG